MESNQILVGKFENNKIFLDDGCGCIYSLDKERNVNPILLHPGSGDRIGNGISKLGIKSLKDITWYTQVFDYHGFDFDQLVTNHPLWVHQIEKLM
jgi:hypothetical protein